MCSKNLHIFLLLMLAYSVLSFKVLSQPVAGFKVNGQVVREGDTIKVCKGSSISYTNSATGYSSISWIFRLGVPSTFASANPPAISYNAIGTDSTIQIAVLGTTRDTFFAIVQVSDQMPTKPVFSFSPTNNECSAVPRTFSVSNPEAGVTYTWAFGDNTTGTGSTVSHTYNAIGNGNQNFSATVTATNFSNCSSVSTSQTVSIKQRPDAKLLDPSNNFRFCGNVGNATLSVYDGSTPTINSNYYIDWGDNKNYNSPTAPSGVPHTYPSGIYTITYTVTGTNGCVDTSRYTLLNISNPEIGAGLPKGTQGCAPLTIKFPISSFLGNDSSTRYFAFFGDGLSDTFKHPPPDTISHTYNSSSCGLNSSNAFTFTIKAKNGCDSSRGDFSPVRVYTKPFAKFSISPNPACVNSLISFINSTALGFNSSCNSSSVFTWNFGDGTVITIPTTANQTHTYTLPGTYTVTLKAKNSCDSTTFSLPLCITLKPSARFIIPDTSGCAPFTVKGTNTSDTSNCPPTKYKWTVTYASGFCGTSSSWSFAPGFSDTSTSPSFIFTNSGTYTIRLSITSPSCGNLFYEKKVTVKKPPTVTWPTISNYCDSVTQCPKPIITNCGSAPLNYAWSFQGGVPETSNVANPCSYFSDSGLHTIALSVSNECGTTSVSRIFRIDTVSKSNAGPNQNLCEITSTRMAADSPHIGTGSWSIVSRPSGSPIPAFSPVTSPTATVSNLVNGTYVFRWRIINGGCTSDANDTIIIKANPSPPAATTPVYYCVGESATQLKATPSPNHYLLWYLTPTGGVGNQVAPTPATDRSGSTTYYVSQVDSTTLCESNRASITVIVSDKPTIASASLTNPTSCGSSTGAIILNGLSPNTNYIVSYEKNGVPQPSVAIRSSGSGVITLGGLSAGNYTNVNVQVASNSCASNIVGPFDLADPTQPTAPTVESNSPICSGSTLILRANTSSSGTISYSWISPLNFSSNQQNPTRTNLTTAMSGTYSVTISVNGCTSAPGSVNVVIDSTPAKPTASSNSPVCVDSTLKLFSSTSLPNVTYSWIGPPPFTSDQQNPVRPNASMAISGIYSVIATAPQGNCSSLPGTTSVIINSPPNISSSSFTNPTTCGNATGSITLNGLPASLSYTVQYKKNNVPFSFSQSSNNLGSLVISGLSAGNYTEVSVSLNSCPSKKVGPFTLTDPPPDPPAVGSNSPICEGGSLNLTSSLAASYSWSGPGFNSGVRNPVKPNIALADAGVYSVTVTVNGCSSSSSINVVVSPKSIGGTTNPNATVCSGINTGTITLSGYVGNVVRWESSTNSGQSWSIINNITSSLTYANLNETTWYRAVIKSGVCPEVYSDTTIITVVKAVTKASAGSDQKLCNVTSTTLNGNPPDVGTGTWTQTFGPKTNTNISNPKLYNTTVTGLMDSVYRFKWTIAGSSPECTSSDDEVEIVIRPVVTRANAGSDQSICYTANNLVALNANLNAGRSFETGKWTIINQPVGGNGRFSGASNPTSNFLFDKDSIYTLQWTINNDINSGRCVASSDIVLIMASRGDTANAGDDQNLCGVDLIKLQAKTPVWGGDGTWTKVSGRDPVDFSFEGSPTTTVTVPSPGSYVFKWTVTNTACPSSEDEVVVIIKDSVTKAAAGKDTSICDFTDQRTIILKGNNYNNPTETGEWEILEEPILGNGRFSNKGLPHSTFSFNQPGKYRLQWTIRHITEGGCPPTGDAVVINVFKKPVADFDVTPLVICVGESVTVKTKSLYANRYYWIWGDGDTSSYTVGQHVYKTGGTFKILQISRIDTLGIFCQDSISKEVRVVDSVTRAKAGSDIIICDFATSRTVTLDANIDPSRTFEKGQWRIISPPPINGTFGDRSNPKSTFSFTQPGKYLLEWSIENVTGSCPPTRDTMVINVFRKPVADFDVTPLVICVGESVTVKTKSLYANRYYWLWGDVDTSSSTKGNHVFESAGTFRIIHVARIDTLGCTSEDTISKEITVLEKIKAGIKVGSSGKCVPYTLNVSPVNATGARLIEWFFNDNGNIIRKTGQAASHPFKVPGSYSVKLVIHTANACTDTATYNFKVYDIPTLNFDPLHTATCSHDTSVTFLANPSYSGTDALRYEWFIKDQLKGTSNPFVYPFRTSQVSDTFTIKALALNSEGCGDTSKAGTIIILPVPEINIKFSPQSPIFEPDYTFTFSNTRPGNQNYIHRWSMGDRSLQTRDGTEITYTYGGTGTYKVKLNVTDFTNGCSNKDSVNVTILPVPGYLYVPNAMCLKCSNASLRRFLPLGKGLSTYHLRIFSPWGQLVFETKELNPDGSPIVAWNGTWLNSQNEKSVLEQDVFRWEIRATYKNGTEWKGMLYPQTGYIKTGFITLIK